MDFVPKSLAIQKSNPNEIAGSLTDSEQPLDILLLKYRSMPVP